MTNQNLLDELARLTDKNNLATDAFRAKTRHPVIKGKGHVTIKGRELRQPPAGQNYAPYEVLVLHIEKLSNVQVARGREPWGSSSMDLDLRWPSPKQDGTPGDFRLGSEIGQTVANSNIESLAELNDVDVEFEEKVKANGKRKYIDRDGVEREADQNIFYYQFTVLGNGSTTIKSDPDITFDDFTSTENETLLSHLAGNNLQAFLQQAVKLGLDPKKQSFVVQRKWSQEAVKRGMAEEIDGVFQVRF